MYLQPQKIYLSLIEMVKHIFCQLSKRKVLSFVIGVNKHFENKIEKEWLIQYLRGCMINLGGLVLVRQAVVWPPLIYIEIVIEIQTVWGTNTPSWLMRLKKCLYVFRNMPERGFSRIPVDNDNILMKDLLNKVLERRKIKNRGKALLTRVTSLQFFFNNVIASCLIIASGTDCDSTNFYLVTNWFQIHVSIPWTLTYMFDRYSVPFGKAKRTRRSYWFGKTIK